MPRQTFTLILSGVVCLMLVVGLVIVLGEKRMLQNNTTHTLTDAERAAIQARMSARPVVPLNDKERAAIQARMGARPVVPLNDTERAAIQARMSATNQ